MANKTEQYYWNQENWEVNRDGVGRPIHPLVALAVAPLLGGLFVVFMPFIGLALFAQAIARRLTALAGPLFRTTVVPIAAPGEAFLTGKRPEGRPESPAGEQALDDLQKEIQARRERE